ncbi:hypothetical protein Pfo_017140 [Paulownia fortunei]|nr:hypothetical protein Pfo_017140 [Paulownia fortunei]
METKNYHNDTIIGRRKAIFWQIIRNTKIRYKYYYKTKPSLAKKGKSSPRKNHEENKKGLEKMPTKALRSFKNEVDICSLRLLTAAKTLPASPFTNKSQMDKTKGW